MPEFILETLIDTLKSLPILLIVYFVIEIIQRNLNAKKLLKYKDHMIGPPLGALAGCIPQCGFSAASATLYNSGVIGAGTLIAVFLSTSDEAIPIMISHSSDIKLMLTLIICKIVIALIAGYLFMYTVFRHERRKTFTDPVELVDCDEHCHEHHSRSVLFNAVSHTLKTAAFICIVLLAINTIVHIIGEDNLQTVLLTSSPFQPLLTGLLGLVPGCATSILIVELLLSGSISFGSAVAGLCTGAGFGFLILFKGKHHIKNGIKILVCTYLAGAVAGMILHLTM